jgi:hypothetical protein
MGSSPETADPSGQRAGDTVDAALAPDILAERDRLGIGEQGVGERAIDALSEGERPGILRQPTAEDRVPPVGSSGPGCGRLYPVRMAWRERRHDLFEAAELPVRADFPTKRPHPGRHRVIPLENLLGRQQSRLDSPSRGAQQRVTAVVRGDRGRASVADLRIAAGMRHEPHHPQVQERRSALRPHVLDGRDGRVVAGRNVFAVGAEVLEAFSIAVRRGDPAVRCRHADAEPVVLADEQDGHRQPLVGGLARRVDRARGGGVIGRRITEAGDGDRVRRPLAGNPQLARPIDRERDADSAR